MEFDMVDNASLGTIIKVVGVGGAGGNAVQHMINQGVSGVEFIVANTDAQALAGSKADNNIQIGETGLGAGMRPDIGRKLAEESRGRIEDALRGAHMVFITAGMGGGTGTGAAPVVAQVAKELGALTVAVVSKPFSYEGTKCMNIAEEGLEALADNVDSLIVILNEKLEEMYEDDSMPESLARADDVLKNAVAGIAEIINVKGYINVDFNDVKTIMGEQGKAMMGTAVASGVDRARIAAEQAVVSPLLDGVELSGARGVLVNITASRSMKLKETKEVMAVVKEFASPDATIVSGVAYDDSMGDEMRVTVVATGLGGKRRISLVSTPKGLGQRDGTTGEVVSPAADAQGISQETAAAGSDLDVPAVWRRPGRDAASVSASATVKALEETGVKKYDIPAFLRRQAD